MKHVYGAVLIAWLAVEQFLNSDTDIIGIALLLSALCLFIIKEKYLDKTVSSFFYLAVVFVLTIYNRELILLAGIPLLDFTYSKKYYFSALILAAASIACMVNGNYYYIFFLASAALFGYITGVKDEKEKRHTVVLDGERRLRYNLEQAQNELVQSKKEIEHLTEIRERNRIAHEIHDNIGHSIAGVIFQLEAALRILHKDNDKAESILKLSSQKLTEALELTRNTVYNIRVDKKTGLDTMEKIINDFKFCKVIFEHSGDFSKVSVSNMKILEANIKECLTNASKHSQAANIHIKIDIGRKNIRLYYKDDGIGCKNINENVGIAGIKDRMKNAGGTVSIDGSMGFLIVCNLPAAIEDCEEEKYLENSDC
jgi:signal transduction histidine kinase